MQRRARIPVKPERRRTHKTIVETEMNKTKTTLTAAIVVLWMLGGCGKSNHKDTQKERQTPGSGGGQSAEQAWASPSYPITRPPAAGGPEIPPEKLPSIYADARIGMRTVMKIYSDDGRSVVTTTDVYSVDRTTVHALQTVQSEVGKYTYDLTYNRFSNPGATDAGWRPEGKLVGTELLEVAGKMLLCDVYENVRNGRFIYRTLRCRDILGWTVRHSDNADGDCKTRLELIEFHE